jgi:hypothetical protein
LETLILFLIFIVFSVVRSLGRQQTRQQPGPQRPMPPGMPRHPQVPQQPRRPERRVPLPQAEPVFEQEYETRKPVVRLRPPERPALPDSMPEYERPWEKPIADLHYAQYKTEDREFDLRLDSDSVLLGVIFSEVLGQPRARRKNIFPVRPVR